MDRVKQLDLFDDYDFYNSYSFDHLQVRAWKKPELFLKK